jgi:hypothetical protein
MSISTSSYEMKEIEGNKVVKWFPLGTPRKAAEDEVHKTLLVRQYGLEAPFVHGVVEEGGRFGIAFDKVIGPTYTQWIIEHPNWLKRLTDYFAHEHHEVHMHKVPELPRLKDVLTERFLAKREVTEPERKRLLERTARMPDGDWLCHMDYVPESIMVSIDGPIVFNWGGAVRGDYLADVAMTSLLLERWVPKPEEREAVEKFKDLFRHGYVTEYIKICGRMDEELEAWRELLGSAGL